MTHMAISYIAERRNTIDRAAPARPGQGRRPCGAAY